MRRALDLPFPAPGWPGAVVLAELTSHTAKEVHELLALGYTNGEGSVGPFAEWWPNLQSDAEFDPALCFVARDEKGIIGVAQCWTSAFLKDLAVHPRRRHEGIGAALLLQVFSVFSKRGARAVDLKVKENNTAAIGLYVKLGFKTIDRHAHPA